MEFKKRLVQKTKKSNVRAKKASGFTRVKIRGRKRWVKAASAE